MPKPDGGSGEGTARRAVSALLGIVVALGLLFWALRGVHLSEVALHLRTARWLPLAAAVVLATATFPLRLVRWRLLLRDEQGGALPAMPLWHAVAIGFMANNLLPFRAGELVRTFAATRLAGARFSTVLSSIAVERIFDGLAVVALLTFALLVSDLPPDVAVGGVSIRHAAQAAGAMGFGALVAAVLVVAYPLAAERLVRQVLPTGRLTDKIVALLEGIRLGLAALRSPTRLAGVVFWSFAVWLVNAWAFYMGFDAFGIPVSFASSRSRRPRAGRARRAGRAIPPAGSCGSPAPASRRRLRDPTGDRSRARPLQGAERAGLFLRHRLSRHHLSPDHPAGRLVPGAHPRRSERPSLFG